MALRSPKYVKISLSELQSLMRFADLWMKRAMILANRCEGRLPQNDIDEIVMAETDKVERMMSDNSVELGRFQFANTSPTIAGSGVNWQDVSESAYESYRKNLTSQHMVLSEWSNLPLRNKQGWEAACRNALSHIRDGYTLDPDRWQDWISPELVNLVISEKALDT